MISNQSAKKRDFYSIIILLTAALCIGIYLLATTVVIAKDGVTFIEYAQKLESAGFKTMLNEDQHPGYPFLILTTHKITSFFYESNSVFSWIYCAQSITLLLRVVTIIILYFIGKKLSGPAMSFWAVLIFMILPNPAKYGSDALSDWPSLCFLAAGLLLMLNGACDKRFYLFGFAGLAGGMGYLIRPECVQLVVSGSLWLGLQLVWHKRIVSRDKALYAICLLIGGFLIAAGPYMKLKGAIFPKKGFDLFTQESRQIEISKESNQVVCATQFTGTNITGAFVKLGQNIGETLVWFFVPAVLIGMHMWFKGRKWYEPKAFFIISLVILNVLLMIFLYCKYGYMSYRHTLLLLIFLAFYVPIGLQKMAIQLQHILSRKAESISAAGRGEKFWFAVLLLTGFFICAPKLFRPIRIEKQGYRAAAMWLEANTNSTDIVAVPDIRIIFYAQREGLIYKNEDNPPSEAVYVVRILEDLKDEAATTEPTGKLVYKYIDERKGENNLVVYKR
jgi:4-amino-4-deoxy-L-arabinose transferase-like glycosyltransferase